MRTPTVGVGVHQKEAGTGFEVRCRVVGVREEETVQVRHQNLKEIIMNGYIQAAPATETASTEAEYSA